MRSSIVPSVESQLLVLLGGAFCGSQPASLTAFKTIEVVPAGRPKRKVAPDGPSKSATALFGDGIAIRLRIKSQPVFCKMFSEEYCKVLRTKWLVVKNSLLLRAELREWFANA